MRLGVGLMSTRNCAWPYSHARPKSGPGWRGLPHGLATVYEARGFHSNYLKSGHHAHAAHATASGLRLGGLGNHALSRQHQAGNRRCVLQCGAGHFGGVQNTHFNHVAVGLVGCVFVVATFKGVAYTHQKVILNIMTSKQVIKNWNLKAGFCVVSKARTITSNTQQKLVW